VGSGSTVVVVVASRAAVVVVASTVVVVGSRVLVGSTVVVVGSTVLSGAGWGSVVVGAAAGGGLEELGGSVTGAVGRAAAVIGARLAGAGADGGGSAGAPVVDGLAGRVLEGASEGAGPVAGAAEVSVGRAPTPVGAGGVSGTKAAEATIAARTAKLSPKATSMSRRGSRRSARWPGVRGGMGCCRIVRLWLGLRILRIVRSNGKSRWVIMG
jgi:hypothetical protein